VIELIVVRHGDYDEDNLTSSGIESVQQLAADLRTEVQGIGSVSMHSSPVTRAVETAEIISKVIGKPFGTVPALDREAQIVPYSQKELPDFPDTLDLVRGLGNVFDVVILVTHAGAACCFPMYYRVHELGLPQEPFRIVEKGYAQILDCETGVLRVI
jgi:phosphohistidine phosphatase SixA